jgi:hypothetical protein
MFFKKKPSLSIEDILKVVQAQAQYIEAFANAKRIMTDTKCAKCQHTFMPKMENAQTVSVKVDTGEKVLTLQAQPNRVTKTYENINESERKKVC